MAKGFVTQGVCLLTDGQTTIENVIAVLNKQFTLGKQVPAAEHWQFAGNAVLLAYHPEVNGGGVVDVIDHPWPDHMGDPKTDVNTFAAWGLGQFGPLAYPGCLERASQHSWAWEPGRRVAERNRGFIRIRISYVFVARGDQAVMPEDYDPIAELQFLSRVVLSVFEAPGVLCYFNPNGEVLRDHDGFHNTWTESERQQKLPLLLWMNIRFFHLSEQLGFMDSVGNGQLDVPDVEAIFPKADYEPVTIDYYLRNVTHYLLESNREIRTGEAIDGPGESNLSWAAEVLENGLTGPPRRVVRLYPKANCKAIQAALATFGDAPA